MRRCRFYSEKTRLEKGWYPSDRYINITAGQEKIGDNLPRLIEGKIFHCFSSNATPFEQNKAYSPSAIYALLEHGGDFKKASKALSAQGYGTPKASPIKIDEKSLKKEI